MFCLACCANYFITVIQLVFWTRQYCCYSCHRCYHFKQITQYTVRFLYLNGVRRMTLRLIPSSTKNVHAKGFWFRHYETVNITMFRTWLKVAEGALVRSKTTEVDIRRSVSVADSKRYSNYKLQPTRCNFSWIYFYRRSTCFRRFLRPSSGTQNYTYSFRYCQPILHGIPSHPR